MRGKLLMALRRGAYRVHACAYARISVSVFHEYLNQGEDDMRNGEATPFAQFVEDVKEAEASPVMSDLAIIELARKKSWQAAAWRLERRYPHLFGRRVVDTREMSEAEAKRMIAQAFNIAEDDLPPPDEL